MVAILEKSEHNIDFHPIVDFVEASPFRYALTVKPTVYISHIRQFWSTARIETTEEGTKILATVDGILRIVIESSLRRNPKLKDEEGISSLPDAELFENLTLMGYNISPNQKFTFQKGQFSHQWKVKAQAHQLSPITHPPLRRARIAQSLALLPVADKHASPLRDVSKGEACPTDSGFGADQDRANIAKTSTLPHDSAPRVTSPAANEGSMQQTLDELTALCTSLQRQHSVMVSKFEAQELEINMLKARVKLLEDRKGRGAERSGDDASIKRRNLDEGEAAAERVSDDTKEMAIVLTSMDAATVLASGVAEVPTGSGSIPTAGSPVAEVPTGSDVVPTASLIFATATIVARELEEQMAREDQRMSEQVARDAKIARIHAEEELQIMIDGLDRSNETVAKYLQEYHQFASELPFERRIELISDLVSNLGYKMKDFKGMTFEEIEAKSTTVWKQIGDFIPVSSKEEAERFKRKGIRFEQESVKKLKTSEEVLEDVKTPDEVPKEKEKEMMQLVPIEEVYVEALQVKHLIIDWKVHTEGQRSYWKITRLGDSSASYQFFMNLLKHMDREDLNQLWA
nr:hypothetical protein [Tanacetum cinerariifolium]